MKRKNQVAFADENIKKAYEKLKSGKGEEQDIAVLIDKAIKRLEENPFCGIRIQKSLIPKEYIKKYNVTNLWKYNLSSSWRLIYTIVGNKVVIVAVILEWMNHKNYNRRFGYG